MTLNIVVVCGSVRKNRDSIKVANFLASKLQQAGCDVQLADFTLLPLPFVDVDPEPSKLKKQYPYENVQAWSKMADAADGFVFVVPEYNHGYSGVLKNALDWLYSEFKYKPAALAGVSSGDGGARRALSQLHSLMNNFGLYDIRESMTINAVKMFDTEGNVVDEKQIKNADRMISALMRVAEAMKPLRQNS